MGTRVLTLTALQERIRRTDHRPGHELEYLQKLVEEVGELARAMRHGTRWADTQQIKGTVDEELFDVLYYVAALANLHGVDLETAARLKTALNAERYGAAAP